MLASENGHVEVVEKLLSAGAELDLQDVVSSDNLRWMERGVGGYMRALQWHLGSARTFLRDNYHICYIYLFPLKQILMYK